MLTSDFLKSAEVLRAPRSGTEQMAPLLYDLVRFHRPRTVVEVGIGYTTAFILRALERSDWNVTATARYLGIPLSTLKHKMARLDLRDLARKLRGA